MNHFRVGFGYDVHRLEKDHDFWLGGIKIPHEKGTIGHSDADVLIHAIIDALLGAANLGDIGRHFPDTSDDYKDIDSKILLEHVAKLLEEKKYHISNIDSTIVLQKPKINDYIPSMQIALADTLGIEREQISIKAKTTEHLGFEGREEGVSAYSVALVYRQ